MANSLPARCHIGDKPSVSPLELIERWTVKRKAFMPKASQPYRSSCGRLFCSSRSQGGSLRIV